MTTSAIAALNESSSRAKATPKPSSFAPVPNSTHLDAVPQATPINRFVLIRIRGHFNFD